MKKNIIPVLLIAGAGYYFYTQSKKKKGPERLQALDPTEANELERQRIEAERIQAEEKKPKTLFAKAAALVKKAASTPEGKSLLKKGVKAITQKKQLKKLGATYL
jgi:uncharacterized protein HemX